MKTYGLKVTNYSTDVNDLTEMRRIGQEILEATGGRRGIKRDLDGLNDSRTRSITTGQKYFRSIVTGYYKFMAGQLLEAMDDAGDILPAHEMCNDITQLEALVREMAGQTIIRKNGYFEIAG